MHAEDKKFRRLFWGDDFACTEENISFLSSPQINTIRNKSENDEQQRVKRRRTSLIFFASAIFFLRRSEDKR